MAELALRPGLVEVMNTLRHSGADVGVEELLLGEGSTLAGRTLREAGFLEADLATLLAVRRRDGHVHINPAPDLALEAGDLIFALGSQDQLRRTAAIVR